MINENSIWLQIIQQTKLTKLLNSIFCSLDILGDYSSKEKGERKIAKIR